MPIKACADKLQREIEDFGFPPNFPEDQTPTAVDGVEKSVNELEIEDKSKSKKVNLNYSTFMTSYSRFTDYLSQKQPQKH